MNTGREVSVVVQGPVHGRPGDPPARRVTQRALSSVRAAWPDAEVILSTWRGTDVEGLDCDVVVTNDDPGAIPINDTDCRGTLNNLNRQLVSTRNGLARATRDYAVKLRSDCLLLRPLDFSAIAGRDRDPAWSVLEQPVLTVNLCTRHPLKRPVLFHVSDLFHFGRTRDLLKLWSPELVQEPGFTRTIDPGHRPAVNAYSEGDFLFRCAPEQYLGENLVRSKFPATRLRHHSDGSVRDLFRWLRILANNFVLQHPSAAGVEMPPHLAAHLNAWDIFQPEDFAWLENWKKPHVPLRVRYRAARRYLGRRLECRRNSPLTSVLQRFHRSLPG